MFGIISQYHSFLKFSISSMFFAMSKKLHFISMICKIVDIKFSYQFSSDSYVNENKILRKNEDFKLNLVNILPLFLIASFDFKSVDTFFSFK